MEFNTYLKISLPIIFAVLIYFLITSQLQLNEVINTALVIALVLATVYYAIQNEKMAAELKRQVELSFEPLIQIPKVELADNHGDQISKLLIMPVSNKDKEYVMKMSLDRRKISGSRFVNLVIKNTSQVSAHNVMVSFRFFVFRHDMPPAEREPYLTGSGSFEIEELSKNERRVIELFDCSEYPIISVNIDEVTGRNSRGLLVKDILSFKPEIPDIRNEDLIKSIE